MAATSPSLRALTAAALALPGLTPAITQAATPGENEAQLQYGVYEESDREIVENSKVYDPMHIETLQGAVKGRLTDRVTFSFNYIQDTWSGATPITTAPVGAMEPALVSGASTFVRQQLLVDDDLNTYSADIDLETGLYTKESDVIHMMTSASPETRKQGTVNFTYEFENAAIDFGGGASSETDYYSRYLNFGGRKDFNQKLTAVSLGFSRTDSDIETVLPSRFDQYIDDSAYESQIERKQITGNNAKVLQGERDDWSVRVGLSQVLSKNSVIETGVGFTRANGFQENPYKAVTMVFVDPDQEPDPDSSLLIGEVVPVMEKRPDTRDQMTLSTRFMHYFANLDAATHLEYRYYRDDWGLRSHTMEGDWAQAVGGGWTITPRLRYYSQNAAEFYQPYFMFEQSTPKYPDTIDPDTGDVLAEGGFNVNEVPVTNYSSDHRLSAFGTLSRGITVSKQFTKGVNLDVGFEYYTHRGNGRMGSGGEGEYADFDSYSLNAAVRVDFAAAGAMIDSGNTAGADAHAGHGEHQAHSGHAAAPAGVMFDHMLTKPGEYMIGYRYMYHRQAGNMIRGSEPTDDLRVVANACGANNCSMTASEHTMHMHMLDFMYAPRDWLNVMIMPQFVDMTMEMRTLEGAPEGGHAHGGSGEHATGGLGDTTVAALIKIGDYGRHHFHATLGMSLPTGDVQQKSEAEVTDEETGEMNGVDQFVDYGMQLGSGTLDFIMGLTYTGQTSNWSWGGQLSTTQRFKDIGNLSDTNESGYALGDIFQITGWGGYNITPSVSATLRGVYTSQDSIDGSYNGPQTEMSPMDYPQNYGGQFYDIGFGLSASPKSGSFKGNRFGIEWLETVKELPKGFQLERAGQLAATWTIPL